MERLAEPRAARTGPAVRPTGRGGGTIASGRHVRYATDTPMANLYLSMLDRLGASTDEMGDSTGRLDGLEG